MFFPRVAGWVNAALFAARGNKKTSPLRRRVGARLLMQPCGLDRAAPPEDGGMKRTHLSPDVSSAAIAACALQVRSDARLQRLFPAGVFDAPRGALAGNGPWRIDAQIAQKVIARAATRSTRIRWITNTRLL